MSADRVFNPITEFRIMTSSPHSLRKKLSCGRQLNRIKRNLFGPVNPIETNKIFNEELEQHQEKAAKKWGFDFRTDSPISSNSQYIWERVSLQKSFIRPEMHTVIRDAHVRQSLTISAPEILMDERSDRENFGMFQSTTDTDSCDESQDESPSAFVFKVPALPTRLCKRQPKMTEYMEERKRSAKTFKTASPAKRLRASSGCSTTHYSHIIHNSIAANFDIRTQSHN